MLRRAALLLAAVLVLAVPVAMPALVGADEPAPATSTVTTVPPCAPGFPPDPRRCGELPDPPGLPPGAVAPPTTAP